MLRRAFILTSASVLLSLASGTLQLTNATASDGGRPPWTPVALIAGPLAPAAAPVGPPGGLGSARAEFERTFGPPTGLQGTMIAYGHGERAASFLGGRTVAIYLALPGGGAPSIDVARQSVESLLPTDRLLIGTLSSGPNRVTEIYSSAWLAHQGSTPLAGAPADQFVVVYQADARGAITGVLAKLGSVPGS